MANDNSARDTDRAWDLMKKIGFAMLVTRDGDKLRARPMSACLEREANTWWDSADDSNILVLKITPDDAEFWDSPGTVISYVKMAAAAVTGTRPDIGENRKVSM